MEDGPDILNHNIETVERLQGLVRKRARYDRSLSVLARAKAQAAELGRAAYTKSSIMVGLGEEREELSQAFRDLRAVDCDILTLGQYLRPTLVHLPLVRYYHPDEFAEMKAEALGLGFRHVEAGPLVRSSYHARDQVPGAALRALQRRQATLDAEGRVIPA
jgi:lipoic acid synthetase